MRLFAVARLFSACECLFTHTHTHKHIPTFYLYYTFSLAHLKLHETFSAIIIATTYWLLTDAINNDLLYCRCGSYFNRFTIVKRNGGKSAIGMGDQLEHTRIADEREKKPPAHSNNINNGHIEVSRSKEKQLNIKYNNHETVSYGIEWSGMGIFHSISYHWHSFVHVLHAHDIRALKFTHTQTKQHSVGPGSSRWRHTV